MRPQSAAHPPFRLACKLRAQAGPNACLSALEGCSLQHRCFSLLPVCLCRELAFQIGDQFRALGAGMSLRDCVVVGGLDMQQQVRAATAQESVARLRSCPFPVGVSTSELACGHGGYSDQPMA